MSNVFDNRCVLIADDDRDVRMLIGEILQSLNPTIRLREAKNGEEALMSIEEVMPDVVVLDLNMPVMDGYKVLERLRANDKTLYLPVLVLTAQDHKYIEIGALDAGADDFLGKPISQIKLIGRMRALIRMNERYRELQERVQYYERRLQGMETTPNGSAVSLPPKVATTAAAVAAAPRRDGPAAPGTDPAAKGDKPRNDARVSAAQKLLRGLVGMDVSSEAASCFARGLDRLSKDVARKAAELARDRQHAMLGEDDMREALDLAQLILMGGGDAGSLLRQLDQLAEEQRMIVLHKLIDRLRPGS